MFIRKLVRPVALALAFAAMAAPITARADDGDADRDEPAEHGHHARRFPMKADPFAKMVERRIEHARRRMEQVIVKRKMPVDTAAALRKDFEAGVAAVQELARGATADGVVSREEAAKLRDLARELREKASEKYGIPAHPEHGGKRHQHRRSTAA